MTRHLDTPSRPARARRRPSPRTAALPAPVAAALRRAGDARERLVVIAESERSALERLATPIVGAVNAQDVVSEVVVRRLERHDPVRDRDAYRGAEGYQRLRASLRVSVRNAAIDQRRRRAWSDVLIGDADDSGVAGVVTLPGRADEEPSLVESLDAAALYDALRRLPDRDLDVLRVKLLDGGTFQELADHLGVRSVGTAHRHYMRALAAAQGLLIRYGDGGFCRDYADDVGLVVLATGPRERALVAERLGAARADEVARHVLGDPDDPRDTGCARCQAAARRNRAALALLIPPAGLAGDAAGVLARWRAGAGPAWQAVGDAAAALAWPGGVATAGWAGTAGPSAFARIGAIAAALAAALLPPAVVPDRSPGRATAPATVMQVSASPRPAAPAIRRPSRTRPATAPAAPPRARATPRTPPAPAGPGREFTPGP